MADATRKLVTSLADKHQSARHAVESWLYAHCSEVTVLGRDDVKGIRRGLVGGRVLLEVADGGIQTIEILIPAAFPFRPARLRLVDMPEDSPWPHAERDDVLCLVPETAAFDPNDPVGGVVNPLDISIDLSRRVAAGEADAEFRAEVLSYWTHRIPADRFPIYSLAEPDGQSKALRVWKGTPVTRWLTILTH